MPTPQRLPIVNSDDGVWGDILRQYLLKEHYDDGTDNAVNGGHKTITIRPGTASAGTAPLKFTTGTLLTTPEAGAMEFAGDNYYLTDTSGPTRRKIAAYDDTSGATGDIYYRNSSGYFTRLAVGSTGDLLTVSGGLPSWSSSISNASTITLKDANFTLQDNSDTTKQLKFELSGISASTTRTLTVPDANTTIVGTDATQTLTNKTLTSPRINQIDDSNGATALLLNPVASAVNHFRVTNAVASSTPTFQAWGSDANVGMNINTKGTGAVYMRDSNGVRISSFNPVTSAVNSMSVYNASTGNPVAITAIGSDTNVGINLIPQGTGKVQANGVEVATVSGSQTLTNKTLTSPTISTPTITGTTTIGTGATSVNVHLNGTSYNGFWANIYSNSASAYSMFTRSKGTYASPTQVTGADQYLGSFGFRGANETGALNNVDAARISVLTEGDVTSTSHPAYIAFYTSPSGSISAVERLRIKGDGDVRVYYPGTATSSVVTIGGTQTLTDKTISGSSNTLSDITLSSLDAASYATTATASTLAQRDANANLTADNFMRTVDSTVTSGGTTSLTVDSAGVQVFTGTSTHTVQLPSAGVKAGMQWTIINQSSSVLTIQSSAGGGLWSSGYGRTGTFTAVVDTPTTSGGWTGVNVAAGKTFYSLASLALTGTDFTTFTFPSSSGTVVTLDATQTLTNKTLTTPVIENIRGANNTTALVLNADVGAVNYFQVSGKPTGNPVYVSARGADTDISLYIQGKGTGKVLMNNDNGVGFSVTTAASSVNRIEVSGSATGSAPSIASAGSDTNISLNLMPKGTGTVQANGVEVATISGTQTLTNKTLTTPKMSYITDTNGNTSMLLTASASAVNFLQVVNSAAGSPVILQPNGSDTNIGFSFRPRGTGTFTFNTSGGANIAAFSQGTSPVNYFYFTPGGTGG